MKIKNKILIFAIFLVLAMNLTSAADVKYCCEKTTYGAWCQNAPREQCDTSGGLKAVATNCESTSYCELGCCYDSTEGLCMENTPQKVCDLSGGTWNENQECNIPQCSLGCCVVGSQAAFTTLTRCKKLSSFYGLNTDFRKSIGTELECLSLASLSDKGACVFELDYSDTCKFTTRQECNSMNSGMKLEDGTLTGTTKFYKDYLCSAEELGNLCGPSHGTTCVEGKDEVYFLDSCGNPANIYDASKVDDKSYWNKIISKDESCNPNGANSNSRTCGNCDYFVGSICKDYKKVNVQPVYGNYVCANLNCRTTTLNKPMKHGESWCSTDKKVDSVGSRYYRHICINGEEIIEACADFRQQICFEDSIESGGVSFSQAGCITNRWQDCFLQTEKIDCENADKRDCIWKAKADISNTSLACVPKNAPGLNFWEGEDAATTCSVANSQCVVKYEKTLLGGKKCVKNCECLEDSWLQEQLGKCSSVGDCGTKINWQGQKGSKDGYKLTITKVEDEEEGGGGLGGMF